VPVDEVKNDQGKDRNILSSRKGDFKELIEFGISGSVRNTKDQIVLGSRPAPIKIGVLSSQL